MNNELRFHFFKDKFFLYKRFHAHFTYQDKWFWFLSLSLFTFSARPHAIAAFVPEESIWQPCNEYKQKIDLS